MSRAKEPQLYEIYEDEAAFTAHRNGPLVARFKAEAAAVERKLAFVTGTLTE
jgi:quinol monooxygenase YgiN